MAYTLDEFAADCRRILEADRGPAGREAVRHLTPEYVADRLVEAALAARGVARPSIALQGATS